MPRKELTEKQKLFLEALFADDTFGSLKAAAIAAGYSEGTNPSQIADTVAEEILDATQKYLALHAPKSVGKMVDVLNDPTQKGASNALAAAQQILDRGGITRKERVEVGAGPASAVIILPTKNED